MPRLSTTSRNISVDTLIACLGSQRLLEISVISTFPAFADSQRPLEISVDTFPAYLGFQRILKISVDIFFACLDSQRLPKISVDTFPAHLGWARNINISTADAKLKVQFSKSPKLQYAAAENPQNQGAGAKMQKCKNTSAPSL